MDSISSFLTGWTIDYIKNKDILTKKIETIEKNKDGFDIIVKYKDKTCFFIIKPLAKGIEEIIRKMDREGYYSLVMLNNKENFNIMINNWKRLIEFKNLCIIFVNPFSQLEKKWFILPYVHNRICEDGSLENGLKAMFEMVEPITQEEMERRLKQKSD